MWPPVCWCTQLLGWVWVGGLITVVLVIVGLVVEELRRNK